jgi:hypothetical protein
MATQYARGAVRPDLHWWIFGDNGQLIDFSSGFTFTVRIGNRSVPALMEKVSGITGQVGSGSKDKPDSIPNIVIAWAAGDLDIAVGEWTLQLDADAGAGSTPRYFFTDIEITDIILAPPP